MLKARINSRYDRFAFHFNEGGRFMTFSFWIFNDLAMKCGKVDKPTRWMFRLWMFGREFILPFKLARRVRQARQA